MRYNRILQKMVEQQVTTDHWSVTRSSRAQATLGET
jgi:hypothetical protein